MLVIDPCRGDTSNGGQMIRTRGVLQLDHILFPHYPGDGADFAQVLLGYSWCLRLPLKPSMSERGGTIGVQVRASVLQLTIIIFR